MKSLEKYEIVNGKNLNPLEIEEVTQLLFDTGYYNFVSTDNILKLDALEFQKMITIKPLLKNIYCLKSTETSDIIGYFIAIGKHITNNCLSILCAKEQSIQKILTAEEQVQHDEIINNHALYIHTIVIATKYRNRGFSKLIFKEIKNLANMGNYKMLSLIVWKSKPAIEIYKKNSFVFTNLGKFHTPNGNDELYLARKIA